MLQQSLLPTEPYEVRFQAVRAIGAFVLIHDKETQVLRHFADLLPGMLEVIGISVQMLDDDTLLKVLIDMAENTPKFLRPQLVYIFEMCTKLFAEPNMMDSWRQLALEV